MLVSERNGKSPRPRGGNNAILLCYTVYPEEDHTAKKKKKAKKQPKSGIRYLTQSLESSKETQTSHSVPSKF